MCEIRNDEERIFHKIIREICIEKNINLGLCFYLLYNINIGDEFNGYKN